MPTWLWAPCSVLVTWQPWETVKGFFRISIRATLRSTTRVCSEFCKRSRAWGLEVNTEVWRPSTLREVWVSGLHGVLPTSRFPSLAPSLEPYSASEVRTIGAFKYYLYMYVCIYIYILPCGFFYNYSIMGPKPYFND